ncbi:unnamed protein product [Chironomus riparius]|uniref:Uncharacterized protein n=1 Tax=Chironomus riparius TaxID=315576 RepID=A0A9N9WTS0_9DIPT|nr:unnamed protein product [Chironomus riparius]
MALWMKKRMVESQRRNGLYDSNECGFDTNNYAPEMNCVKPVEPQFNYNFQSWSPTTSSNYTSMPEINDQQCQQQSTYLEQVQDSIEAKKEFKHQPNVPQSNLISSNAQGWTVVDENKNISVAADRGDSNVMTLPPGAYYDEPIYIDPMTYQQQHQQQQQQANSINVASNAATQMDFRQNLAQSYRCANADCTNCRNSMGKS